MNKDNSRREFLSQSGKMVTAAALFAAAAPVVYADERSISATTCDNQKVISPDDTHYYLDNVLLESGFEYENDVVVHTRTERQTLEIAGRISLGVKQLAEDPFNNYLSMNKKGAIVTGKVTAVDAKGATVELAGGVEGYLRASEASRDRIEDATLVLNVGDEVEAKFTGVDRKNRVVSLSVRAKDEADEKDAIATVNNKQEEGNFSNAMAEAFKAAKGE